MMEKYQIKKQCVFIMVLMIFCLSSALAQDPITLRDCYENALAKTPLVNEKEIYNSLWQLKDKNLSLGWLPSFDAGINAVYNSEVADISAVLGALPVPGIAGALSPLPNDQYKFTIDINQIIYDGGFIKNTRALENAGLGVNLKQTEVELYKIKAQINSYFFAIILLDRQTELIESHLETIDKRLISMQSAHSYGIILRSDIDILTSEKLKIRQQIIESGLRKDALLRVLSDITGSEITSSKDLILPPDTEVITDDILRPELQLFDLRKDQLSAGLKIIESRRKPKAFGFATLGYGNPPGNNFFRDEFAPYYIMGAGIKWNIFDWNKARNEKKEVYLQQEILEGKKNDLSDNLKRILKSKKSEIESLKSLINTDAELIALRRKITLAAESQYENGVITATEYLNELNSEQQVRINSEIHKINLTLARIEYLNISGQEIE